MTEFEKRYFATLRIDPAERKAEGASATKLETALTRAYELRSFEIEHYWKRATYFWGFQVAVFAAFGLFWKQSGDDSAVFPELGLTVLGVLTALANLLSAIGSKFWQKNWESHIDMLEDQIEGRLHKTVWVPDHRVGYSVSGINQTLAWILLVFWSAAFVYVALLSIRPPWERLSAADWAHLNPVFVVISAIALAAGAFALLRTSTKLKGTFPSADGAHGTKLKDRWRWWLPIGGEPDDLFVLRYRKDEKPRPEKWARLRRLVAWFRERTPG